jgi:hypothetical protein
MVPTSSLRQRRKLAGGDIQQLREDAEGRNLARTTTTKPESDVLAPWHDRPDGRERLGEALFQPEYLLADRQGDGGDVAEHFRERGRDLRVAFADVRRRLREIIHHRNGEVAVFADTGDRRPERAHRDRVDRQRLVQFIDRADDKRQNLVWSEVRVGRARSMNGFGLATIDFTQISVVEYDLAVCRADIDDGDSANGLEGHVSASIDGKELFSILC